MFVCINVSLGACMFVCVCVCVYIYLCVCESVHICVCACMSVQMCMHTCGCAWISEMHELWSELHAFPLCASNAYKYRVVGQGVG